MRYRNHHLYISLLLLLSMLTSACEMSLKLTDVSSEVPLLSASSPANSNSTDLKLSLDFRGQSVNNFDASKLIISNAKVSQVEESGGLYTIFLEALSEGEVTVQVPEGVFSSSGAPTKASNILRFSVDLTPPQVSVAPPTVVLGNLLRQFEWLVSYDDDADKISLNIDDVVMTGSTSGCARSIAEVAGKPRDRKVIVTGCSGDGVVSLALKSGTAADKAGNLTSAVTGAVMGSVTIDNTPPTFTKVDPVKTIGRSVSEFIWSLEYSGATAISLSASDVSLTGAIVGCTKSVSGTGNSREVKITGCLGNGTVNVAIAGSTASDDADNSAAAMNLGTLTIDNNPPFLSLLGPTPFMGNSSTSFRWQINYLESSSITLSESDITLTGEVAGCVLSIEQHPVVSSIYIAYVTGCTGNGTLDLSVKSGTATDLAGNIAAGASSSSSATVDNIAPTIIMGNVAPHLANSSSSAHWAAAYLDATAVTLTTDDLELVGANEGCAVQIIDESDSLKTFRITGCTGNGQLRLGIKAGTARDAAGNLAAAIQSSDYLLIDNIAPTISSAAPTPSVGKVATVFEWTLTYSGASTINLTPGLVTLTGVTAGCLKNIEKDPDGVTVKVKVSGCTGDGELGISILASSASDAAGNTAQAYTPTGKVILKNMLDPHDPDVQNDLFIIEVDTRNLSTGSSAADEFSLPLNPSRSYKIAVDWGDGSAVTQISSATSTDRTHRYTSGGIKTIRILGTIPQFAFSKAGDRLKILDVKQWGTNIWAFMTNMFAGCENLLGFTATDAPDLSAVTSAAYMFNGAKAFNGAVNHWDTSNISSMEGIFQDAESFNQPMSNWKTGKVSSLVQVFYGAKSFDQDIESWDTSKVTNASFMFANATKFNQSVDAWDVRKLKIATQMFLDAANFNQPLNSWETLELTDMGGMFRGAAMFNQPLSNWDTSKVTNMSAAFLQAVRFNYPLPWNTSSVTLMNDMFWGASLYNQDLSAWDVDQVTNFQSFAAGASAWTLPKPNFISP